MNEVMKKVNANGVEMDMLGEVCRERLDGIVAKNHEYIKQAEICVGTFNQLKENLTEEQKILLFQYDEAAALKEVMLINIMALEMSIL